MLVWKTVTHNLLAILDDWFCFDCCGNLRCFFLFYRKMNCRINNLFWNQTEESDNQNQKVWKTTSFSSPGIRSHKTRSKKLQLCSAEALWIKSLRIAELTLSVITNSDAEQTVHTTSKVASSVAADKSRSQSPPSETSDKDLIIDEAGNSDEEQEEEEEEEPPRRKAAKESERPSKRRGSAEKDRSPKRKKLSTRPTDKWF